MSNGSKHSIDRSRTELLTDLSRRLREPLTSVLGPLQDLERGCYGLLGRRPLRQVRIARRAAQRLKQLVDRLLDPARLETGVEPWPAQDAEARGVESRGATDREVHGVDARTAAPTPETPADRATVLVIDDQVDIRTFVRAHLEPPYRVVEAADGAAGLACARELLPDLVVADVMMPEMDGFALCRALKEDPETDWLPVMLLTAKAATLDKLDGLHLGADDYLTKPFDARELEARVDNLIASRRRLLEHFQHATNGERPALPLAPGVRATADDRDFLERARRVIAGHLGDEGFNVDSLADSLAVDRTNLFRRLRELTGLTPSTLIRELRLESAARRLAEGDGTVGEIATAVGFKDLSHFTRCFRARYRCTPSAYPADSSDPPSLK